MNVFYKKIMPVMMLSSMFCVQKTALAGEFCPISSDLCEEIQIDKTRCCGSSFSSSPCSITSICSSLVKCQNFSAEFIQTTTVGGINQGVTPGTAFTFGTQVLNNSTIGCSATTSLTASAGAGGTVFTLTVCGIYLVDYEFCFNNAGSVGIATGATAASLVIDPNTIAGVGSWAPVMGSSGFFTPSFWLHGRAFINAMGVSAATPLVFAIEPYVGTFSVQPIDASNHQMSRITIQKVS